MDITKEEIEELNNIIYKQSGNWEQGIYKEPNGIDTTVKGLVIYKREETGGVSGGSCWDSSNPRRYEKDVDDEFIALDVFLEKYFPNISYLQYKKISKLICTNDNTEYEYYGNSTDYKTTWIVLDELIELLESFK